MKRSDKILLFFVLLISFVFSVCLFFYFNPMQAIQDAVKDIQAACPWLNYVFAGYSIILCVCIFILLLITLFSPDKSNLLIIKKSKGELQFSKKTIESTVRYSFAGMERINFSKVRVKIHRKPEKTKVFVKLSLNDTKELVSLTGTVQEKISSTLQKSLGITVESITIKVTEFRSDTDKKENSEVISKDSFSI